MSLQKNTIRMNDPKPNVTGKTTLNPHAAEFVPFSLRSSSVNTSSVDTSPRPAANAALGKAVLHRTESSVSNNSDEEARQFWSRQLPDDITPDFKVSEDEDSREMASVLLDGLSFNDSGYETSKFVPSAGNQYAMSHLQDLNLTSPHSNGSSFTGKSRYSKTSYEDDTSSADFLNLASEHWGAQTGSQNQMMAGGMDSQRYIGNSTNEFVNTLLGKPIQSDDQINPFEFLAAQFPGFAAESLAEVYCATQCDLNLTIEMLTQLELQVDTGFNQNLTPKTMPAPTLSPSDFSALSGHGDLQKYSEDMQLNGNGYRFSDKENLLFFKSSPSIPSGGAVDFASAVKKLASQTSGTWKHEKNSSPGSSIGSSRISQLATSSYNNLHGRTAFGDSVKNHGSARAAPVWLETGEAVGNMYSELREEARHHARVRNVYFEQARQAYLIGNKALAKELSVKGQLYNMRMKAAHGKAQESIYRHRICGLFRNPVSPEMQLNGRHDRMMIDLHGLHVSEAIHKLKLELGVLRSAARANDQQIPVFICVGTGHHTRGSRTPVRLPVAVQQFLLEEGVDYSETQPGLLRVVIY